MAGKPPSKPASVTFSSRRALGVIRLSELTDETTSPERQKMIIESVAQLRGSTIAGWAIDLDVSASKVHPSKRPQLGSWLARPDDFDEIIFWRIDRFVRKLFPDFADMIKYALDHDKGLVSATETLDLQTPMGRAMASLVASFAEMETAATSERVIGTHKYLRSNGRWGNGKPTYGYKSIKSPTGGYVLVEDDSASSVLREIVDRVIQGESTNSIVIDLNERRIPTPFDHGRSKDKVRGVRWSRSGLMEILRGQGMLGYVTYKGKTVSGEDGMPLRRTEALLTHERWSTLQAALDRRSRARKRTYGASPLLDVAFCQCGEKLYRWAQERKGQLYAYYMCSSRNAKTKNRACGTKPIKALTLEEAVKQVWLSLVKDWEIQERVYVPGEDHSDELGHVKRVLAVCRDEYDTGQYDYPGGEHEYQDRVKKLTDRLKILSTIESQPSRWEYRGTGETYGEHLSRTGDWRTLVVKSGLRVPDSLCDMLLGLRPVDIGHPHDAQRGLDDQLAADKIVPGG